MQNFLRIVWKDILDGLSHQVNQRIVDQPLGGRIQVDHAVGGIQYDDRILHFFNQNVAGDGDNIEDFIARLCDEKKQVADAKSERHDLMQVHINPLAGGQDGCDPGNQHADGYQADLGTGDARCHDPVDDQHKRTEQDKGERIDRVQRKQDAIVKDQL